MGTSTWPGGLRRLGKCSADAMDGLVNAIDGVEEEEEEKELTYTTYYHYYINTSGEKNVGGIVFLSASAMSMFVRPLK